LRIGAASILKLLRNQQRAARTCWWVSTQHLKTPISGLKSTEKAGTDTADKDM